MSLTRDAILAAKDFTVEEVEVPEWNGTVFVRSMEVAEQEIYVNALTSRTDDITGLQGLLASLTICDADGVRLFTEADIGALARKSWAAMSRVCDVAQRLNHMSPESLEKAKGESAPGR